MRALLASDHGPPAAGLDAALDAAVGSARERGLVVHLRGTALADREPATGPGLPAAGPGHPPAAVVAALVGATGEALANVERHAGTGEAWVLLDRSADFLTIRIHDRGRVSTRDGPARTGSGCASRCSAGSGRPAGALSSTPPPAGGPPSR